MFRTNKYVFPSHLIPPNGCRIIIYGYGDMGKDYEEYLYTSKKAEIVAITDRNYGLLAFLKYPVNTCRNNELLAYLFDFVVIASPNFHDEIREYLVSIGIAENKIIFSNIVETVRNASNVANLIVDYFNFIGKTSNNGKTFIVNPLLRPLVCALDKYVNSDLLQMPKQALELIETFKQFDTTAFSLCPYEDERLYYGHIFNILKYGNVLVDLDDTKSLPGCVHGVRGYKFPQQSLKVPLTFCCNDIPGMSVPNAVLGPYIAYTTFLRPTLDEIVLLKQKLGKVLTIYCSHTSFFNKHSVLDYRFLKEIVNNYRSDYSNILCSIYYNDLTAELLDFCETIGLIPVTAGVRTDQQFMERVYCILKLTDDALFFDYWSDAMSYAVYLGKNVIYYDIGVKYGFEFYQDGNCQKTEEYKQVMKSILKSGEFISGPAKQYIRDMFCHDKVRTPDEVKALFEINATIYSRAFGDRAAFENITNSYVSELIRCNSDDSELKYRLLSEAINSRR